MEPAPLIPAAVALAARVAAVEQPKMVSVQEDCSASVFE
jgi:hypothetical protein